MQRNGCSITPNKAKTTLRSQRPILDLGRRCTRRRPIHRLSRLNVGIWRRLQFDSRRLSTKVTVRLRIGRRILRGRLVRMRHIPRITVIGLIRRRRTGRRSHPAGSDVRSKTTSATATSVEAAASVSIRSLSGNIKKDIR